MWLTDVPPHSSAGMGELHAVHINAGPLLTPAADGTTAQHSPTTNGRAALQYPRRDSNAGRRLRRPVLYPTELRGLTALIPHFHPLRKSAAAISLASMRRGCYNEPAMNSYPQATWRLIRSRSSDGATQMAMDEAIWQAVAEDRAPPTLRLYAWKPPCLSLGRHQSVGEVNREALRAAGYDLLRRPTGGRAILHTDELTYSAAIPLSDPRVRGGVLASCEQLSQGLIQALENLGIQDVAAHRRAPSGGASLPNRLSKGHSTEAPPQKPVCFEAAADFEIVVSGQKLIGSAQMRGRGGLLQHGTLPLQGDIARICPFLIPPANPRRVRDRATTLEAVMGRPVSWEETARAVADGFAQALNLHLEPGTPTPQEKAAAEQLREGKYRSEQWTARS